MANTENSVQFVLHQEDSTMQGLITTLAGDRGGATRFGIASRFHPGLVEASYYDLNGIGEPTIPHDEALAMAEKTYAEQYAAPLRLKEVESQDVANRLLSFAVNEGIGESVAIAQKALNSLGSTLTVDGVFGDQTLAAVNAADPAQFEDSIRLFQREFYRHICSVNPALMPYLNGFLNRADA